MEKRSISVIGTGALGSVLTLALFDAGFSIASLFNRHETKTRPISRTVNASRTAAFPEMKKELGTLVFITVPDHQIEAAARQLSAVDDDFGDYIFVHCSGNKSAEILQPLRQKGALAASFHPLQTFTAASVPSDFNGIYVDIQGEKQAISYLTFLCEQLQCRALEISPEAKPYLHAAAVMVSNNLVALMESASQIAELGGMEKANARRALTPLAQKSLQHITDSSSLSGALSGPIARGDAATVADHIKLLEHHPRFLALYKQLGAILVNLAREEMMLSDQKYNQIAALLDGSKSTK